MPQGTCSIGLCERPARARGWCSMHYQRWQAHGDPTAIVDTTGRGERNRSLIERLNSKIDASGSCWIWTGCRVAKGYGQISVGPKMRVASRVMYEIVVGPIPDGFQVDHLCRNPPCVNPAHLEAVTPQENLRRQHEAQRRDKQTV